MPLHLASLCHLFGLPPDSSEIIVNLEKHVPGLTLDKEVKTYPDATYHNYHTLGISLCFTPASGKLALDSIDIFNSQSSSHIPSSRRSKGPTYSPSPSPIVLHFAELELVLPPRKAGEKEVRLPRDELLEVTPATTGREIVRCLGEPTRKGSGGWVGVWLEWGRVGLLEEAEGKRAEVGIMLELSDPKGTEEMTEDDLKKGMGGVWDRAAGWRWAGIKIFRPTG